MFDKTRISFAAMVVFIVIATLAIAFVVTHPHGSELVRSASDGAKLKDEVDDWLVKRGMPRDLVLKMRAWEDCTDAAIERFAGQSNDALR
jgi:hypothetical protein